MSPRPDWRRPRTPEALSSGGHWHHGRVEQTHPAVHDELFQHELITALAEHTGTHLRNS